METFPFVCGFVFTSAYAFFFSNWARTSTVLLSLPRTPSSCTGAPWGLLGAVTYKAADHVDYAFPCLEAVYEVPTVVLSARFPWESPLGTCFKP